MNKITLLSTNFLLTGSDLVKMFGEPQMNHLRSKIGVTISHSYLYSYEHASVWVGCSHTRGGWEEVNEALRPKEWIAAPILKDCFKTLQQLHHMQEGSMLRRAFLTTSLKVKSDWPETLKIKDSFQEIITNKRGLCVHFTTHKGHPKGRSVFNLYNTLTYYKFPMTVILAVGL